METRQIKQKREKCSMLWFWLWEKQSMRRWGGRRRKWRASRQYGNDEKVGVSVKKWEWVSGFMGERRERERDWRDREKSGTRSVRQWQEHETERTTFPTWRWVSSNAAQKGPTWPIPFTMSHKTRPFSPPLLYSSPSSFQWTSRRDWFHVSLDCLKIKTEFIEGCAVHGLCFFFCWWKSMGCVGVQRN